MMKLNKNSATNNTSELPDKGILQEGSDLFVLEDGRYYIVDISTMVNIPNAEIFSGGCVLVVVSFDDENTKIKRYELWNASNKYAFAGTVEGAIVADWALVGGSGGGSDLSVGEQYNFAGKVEDIKLLGEFHPLNQTKVFTEEEYGELVGLNRDSLEGTNGLTLLSQVNSNTARHLVYPENIKFREDQLYYVTGQVGYSNSSIYINSNVYESSISRLIIGYSSFFKTPGISVDDGQGTLGSGYGGDARYVISNFTIKNITMFNGDVKEGFITTNFNDVSDSYYFFINVKTVDDLSEDLSDWVNQSTGEKQSNECSSYSSGIGKVRVYRVTYMEDHFYMWISGYSTPKKYSYDFSGGTLKEVNIVSGYNSVINADNDKSKCTQFGGITENIYQFDSMDSSLQINGSKVVDILLNDSASNFKLNSKNFSTMVHEYEDKIFYYVWGVNISDSKKSIHGGLYYDGTKWNTVIIPLPAGIVYDDGVSKGMVFDKIDLSTGLLIASLRQSDITDAYGGSTNTYNKFVYSVDYGSSWLVEPYISNGSYNVSSQTFDIYDLHSNNMQGIGKGLYTTGNNGNFDDLVSSRTSFLKEGTDTFTVSTDGDSYSLRWNYDVILSTFTVIGQTPNNPKINEYLKTKEG